MNEPKPTEPTGSAVRSSAFLGPQVYKPEIWQVPKDAIYFATPAIENGLEYTRELLAKHDVDLGRSTRKNKLTAEAMERDIEQMLEALKYLRACGPNDRTERLEAEHGK